MKIGLGLSLRAKITLALLVTGLVSAVLVGIIARLTFLQQFNRAMFDASFQSFSGDVTAYVEVEPGLAVTMTFGIDADISRARVEQLVEAADARLYAGKRAGRNRVVCEPAQQTA